MDIITVSDLKGSGIMSTRGIYGFYKNGIDKITYNHWDSYPTELGESIIKFIFSTSIEEMNNIFNKIIMVDEESNPTLEQIKECQKYYDDKVGEKSICDWYCLLRKSQGKIESYKSDLIYMIDGKDFIHDSLYCEWVYIINLDTNELEIYEGFQMQPNKSRYSKPVGTAYDEYDIFYTCKLVKSVPFNELDIDLMKELQDDKHRRLAI